MDIKLDLTAQSLVGGEYCSPDCPFFDKRSPDYNKCRLFGLLINNERSPREWIRAKACKDSEK